MKKLSFLLILVLPFLVAAQGENHLTFKNIPITGNVSDFVSEMSNAGFTVVEELDNETIMKGIFVNKECNIHILTSLKTNQVWKVVVFLPESYSWDSIKSDYFKFKEQFTAKYGQPSDNFEFFTYPYFEGDGNELQALSDNSCIYSSYWSVKNGSISVNILKSSIVFMYEDSKGEKIRKKEVEETIMDDI